MSQIPYNAPPPLPIKTDGTQVEIPPPLARPDEAKGSIMRIVMMVVMGIVMGGMMFLMIRSGGLQNPMMMMGPMMMIVMMGSMFMMQSQGASDIGQSVRNYLLHLVESRKHLHVQGKTMFEAQRVFFPQPEVCAELVRQSLGTQKGKTPVGRMWTIGFGTEAGLHEVDPGAGQGTTYNPFMSARIGLGTVLLEPRVETEPLEVRDNLEPATFVTYGQFMRNQRYVTGMPIAFDLKAAPFYQYEGDRELVLALSRAMITSLAFNHSPSELAIIVVTENPDASAWQDMKWLPHTQHPDVLPNGDTNRMVYADMATAWARLEGLREGRGRFGSTTHGAPVTPRLLFVVDSQGKDWALPDGLEASGLAGATFLFISEPPEGIIVPDEATLYVARRRRTRRSRSEVMLSTGVEKDIVIADQMPAATFGVFVRSMSKFRPLGWNSGGEMRFDAAADETEDVLDYFEALGIHGSLDEFDPRAGWRKTEMEANMIVPVGYVLNDDGSATREILTLDIAMSSKEGTGPSGVAQGVTGSGKSFWLAQYVLTMAVRFSPSRLNFVLMDFKGGATFIGYENLPHVQTIITNLEEDKPLLDRMDQALKGELARRERLITKEAGCIDIDAYRVKRAKHPELGLPELPSLMVIGDEFREFIMNNREYGKLFESIAQKGRALGMHLLLVSQFIDQGVIGDVQQNLTYGMSLRAATASYSTAVIGTPAAVDLPLGTGDAYLRRDNVPGKPGGDVTRFRGFNTAVPYIPPKGEDEVLSRASLSATQAAISNVDGRAIKQFTSESNMTVDSVDEDSSIADEASTTQVEDIEYVSQGEALLAHLAAMDVDAPFQLWTPPLDAPLGIDECAGRRAQDGSLTLTLGLLDDPFRHRRIPYEITMENEGAQVRIVGAPGSGVSTTIETIIASACRDYGPEFAQFHIVDGGTKLNEVTGFPNVGSYTRMSSNPDDHERVDRFIGEFARIVALRGDVMGERGLASFASYYESKQADPVAGDPYGHLILVIDRVHDFMKFDDEEKTRLGRLESLASQGGPRGVHLVVGGSAETIHYKIDSKFGTIIHHRIQDISNSTITYPTYDVRELIKAMGSEQTGRTLELSHQLHGRVMMPYPGRAVETADSKVDKRIYEQRINGREQIIAYGQQLADQWHGVRAPEIVTVPKLLSPQSMYELYNANLEAGLINRTQPPMGVSAADLRLVTLPDTSVGQDSPHLVITGDQQSGKTTVLRGLIRWLMSTYKPGEAVVYIADPAYALLAEKSYLERTGLLAGYAADKRQFPKILEEVTQYVQERQPRDDIELSAKAMRTRGWWSGPEVFFIADPITSLTSAGMNDYLSGGSPADQLGMALSERNDIGVHVWVTVPAHALQMQMTQSKLLGGLYSTLPATLLLSSTENGTPFGSMMSGNAIRWTRRRPGLGQLYIQSSGLSPIIQTANEEPWPDLDDA